MILVDESYLNNHTIIRIGEEVGIYKLEEESLREYVIRVIQELQPKNEMKIENDLKNELKFSF